MSKLPDIQENNEQLLNDIQNLQQIEQQFFTSLETNPNIPYKEQQKIIEKINQISNMRIQLYQTLSNVNTYYGDALGSSLGTLKEQTAAIGIVENELNRAKKNLKSLESEKNNKIRLVEINDYYGEKYSEHALLMKIIILTLIPIIFITFLYNRAFLPSRIYFILLVIITVIGAIYFWYCYASIIMRDNMHYQEYDWHFNAANAPKGNISSTDPWLSYSLPGTCIGASCCSDGQFWDPSFNQCIGTSTLTNPNYKPPKPSQTSLEMQSATETFISNVLTKTGGDIY